MPSFLLYNKIKKMQNAIFLYKVYKIYRLYNYITIYIHHIFIYLSMVFSMHIYCANYINILPFYLIIH